ncbi:MAG: hypothetical protein AAGA67_06240 [Cyanobacteria bacterium P01_F01_bin.153]
MNRIFLQLFTSAAILFGAITLPISVSALEVVAESENIVASRLEGRWEGSVLLNQFLQGESPPVSGRYIIEFVSDNTVVDKISQRYENKGYESLAEKMIYMAGQVFVEENTWLFLLIENAGNSAVILFREDDGEPVWSFNVMLAVSKDRANDLLFIDGGFFDDSFTGLLRSPHSASNSTSRSNPSPPLPCCAPPEISPQTSPQR